MEVWLTLGGTQGAVFSQPRLLMAKYGVFVHISVNLNPSLDLNLEDVYYVNLADNKE